MGKNSRKKWNRRDRDPDPQMTPFERSYVPQSEINLLTQALLDKGYDQKVIEEVLKEESTAEIYINNLYQVSVNKDSSTPDGMIHLSIKRRDRSPVHDWRHLQQIKNEMVGSEHEAMELYPAESRLMDTANQYHLYVLENNHDRFPVGYRCERSVTEESIGKSKQRKF